MPVGVKVSEKDMSLYSNSSYANPCLAVIGTATKGPIGVPTLCISQRDLKTKFGLQNPNCLGIYAANYFLAEVNRCYYIRVAKDAVASTVNIPGTTNGSTTVENLLTLEASSAGTFYDGYSVNILNATPEKFDLVVRNVSNNVLSSYKDLTLNKTSDNYIGKILEGNEYVKLKETAMVEGTTYTVTNGKYTLANGSNGITGLTSAEYISAMNLVLPDNLDIELLITPGVTDPAVIQKGLSIAEQRGDLLYIIDPPSGLSYEDVIAWHNGTRDDDNHTAFNSSFGAMYWDWVYIYDEINSQEVLVPPSVVVPAVFARSDNMTQPWYAPAGLTRGLIKNVLRSATEPDSDMVDLLYTDPNNINPIITHPTFGLAVFGQKTLWRQSTSLNRVNVRRLVTYIKHLVKDISQYLVFEPNDSTTWNSFKDLVNPRLRNIRESRGLYAYKIIRGEDIVTTDDIDNYRMPAQILIKPTKSAEFIPIDIVITSTGTDFNEYNSAYESDD